MPRLSQLPALGRDLKDEDLVYVVKTDETGAKQSHQSTGAEIFGEIGAVLDYINGGGQSAPDVVPAGEPLHLRHFGVYGADAVEDLIDETAGWQRAITAAVTGKKRLIVPATNYRVSQRLDASLDATHWLELVSAGGRAKIWGTDALASSSTPNILRAATSSIGPEDTWELAEDAAIGDRKIKLGSVTGLAVGQIVCLRCDTEWPYDGRNEWEKGEVHLIAKVDADTLEITFQDVLRDRYTVAENVRLNVRPRGDCVISGIDFEFEVGRENSTCVALLGCRAVVEDVTARMAGVAGLSVQRSVDFHVNRFMADRIGGGSEEDGFEGYGTSVVSSAMGRLTGFRSYACRRGIDLNGSSTACPTRDILVDDFLICGGGDPAYGFGAYMPDGTIPSFGVGTHGPCDNATFRNGLIAGVNSGITVRGLDTVIDGVRFIGAMSECVYATYGEGLTVRNCLAASLQGSSPLLTVNPPAPSAFVTFSSGTATTIRWKTGRPTMIVDNEFHGMADAFILGDNQPVLKNIIVAGNKIAPSSDTAALFKTTATTALEIQSGVIGPNPTLREGISVLLGANVTAGVTDGLDNVVQTGPGRFVLTIPDDGVKAIRLAQAGVLSGVPVHVRITSADSSNAGDFMLLTDGSSVTYGHLGGQVATTTGALTGTTGTDGKLTLSLTAASLVIENRLGGSRALTVMVS